MNDVPHAQATVWNSSQ